MQDTHSIGGGGTGRLFGGGDRRLRPHGHHQALKCPRCDSLNTKFCYYNNYNLSQPRHYCKSCRRYWTKGGVLRNVPVGGGCRKTKRSKPKPNSSDDHPRERKKSSSHSSSESSSLTAAAAADVGSATTSTSAPALLNFPDSRFFNIPHQSADANLDPQLADQPPPPDGGIFADAAGNFSSMMASSNDSSFLGFSAADITSYRLNHSQILLQWQSQSEKMAAEITTSPAAVDEAHTEEMTAGFLDDHQAAQIDLTGLQNGGTDCGLAPLDWQASGDQGLFDLTGTAGQSYWTQTQWATDHIHTNDHSLYLP